MIRNQVSAYNKVQCLKPNRFKDEKHVTCLTKIYRYGQLFGMQSLWSSIINATGSILFRASNWTCSNNQYKKHSNQQMPYMEGILQWAFFYDKPDWFNLRAKLYKREVRPLDCHNKVLWSLLITTERMNDNDLGKYSSYLLRNDVTH